MESIREELVYEAGLLNDLGFLESGPRLVGLLSWMESKPEIKAIIDDLETKDCGVQLLRAAGNGRPPQPRSSEEVAAVGLALMRETALMAQPELYKLAYVKGIRGNDPKDIKDAADAALKRYVEPFVNYVLRRLPEEIADAPVTKPPSPPPAAIAQSLVEFRSKHPDAKQTCFIMMRFTETKAHQAIEEAIKGTLKNNGLVGLLARDKDYCEDLYPNIQTYLHGCGFGIAVFERIEADEFNPNVSLEVGYMFGLRKPVLLLKDKTLRSLHTDLVGKLYKPFDPQDPGSTIPSQIQHWLEDKNLI
jgi:hypothetical protein